jgi:hypothetical protein
MQLFWLFQVYLLSMQCMVETVGMLAVIIVDTSWQPNPHGECAWHSRQPFVENPLRAKSRP